MLVGASVEFSEFMFKRLGLVKSHTTTGHLSFNSLEGGTRWRSVWHLPRVKSEFSDRWEADRSRLPCDYAARDSNPDRNSCIRDFWVQSIRVNVWAFIQTVMNISAVTPFVQFQLLHPHNGIRINARRHPCLSWDSNRRSQCSRWRRQFMP
jgi:hypothetical protein